MPAGKTDDVCVICNNVFACNHFCSFCFNSNGHTKGAACSFQWMCFELETQESGDMRGGNRVWGLLAGAQGRPQEQHPRNEPPLHWEQLKCWLRIWGGSKEGTPHGTLGSLRNTSAPNKGSGTEFVYLSAYLQLSFQALLSHWPCLTRLHTTETEWLPRHQISWHKVFGVWPRAGSTIWSDGI